MRVFRFSGFSIDRLLERKDMKLITKSEPDLSPWSFLSCLSLSFLSLSSFAVPHVRETLTLTKGWNAVYVESTADDAACERFFAGTSVVGAAGYISDADAATAQYDQEGEEIVQKPVVFRQWVKGESGASTLGSITGGSAYLIYAENDERIEFYGVPTAPRMTWHKAVTTNELFNLAGVSSADTGIPASAYFGEGPFGASKTAQAVYALGGTDVNGPDLKSISSFGKAPQVEGGKAYAVSATSSGEWPGVIGVVGGSALTFSRGASYASVRIRNCGTREHVFAFRMAGDEAADPERFPPLKRQLPRVDALGATEFTNVTESSAWEVALKPEEMTEQVFALDRSQLVDGTTNGAILVIYDQATRMRVRIPVIVAPDEADAVRYPTGLWVGEVALSRVSGIDDATPTPVTAGGVLKMSVMMHVDENGRCKLLQRVAAGVDTNGAARLFKDLANVPSAEVEGTRRLSTVMMSVDTPVVAAESDSTFGDDAAFTWTVDAKARDNPFRHAWHPDHDGKKADYSGDLPAGDDFSLYANPVKPELWSISNRLDFSWHEQGNRSLPVHFPYNAGETTSGVVTWEVAGLVANKPIRSVGTFKLKRVFKAKKIEE